MAKLSALKVIQAGEPGLYGDGDGLFLQVGRSGSKSWIFRYAFADRRRDMGLGSLRYVGLAEARAKALGARKLLLEGMDPIEERAARKKAVVAAAAKSVTFKAAASKFIEANKSGWRNTKHADQWTATLEKYAYPVMGDKPVDSIDQEVVLQVLEPIWSVKTETARRVRGRIENILDWARARGLRTGENPARWRGLLEHSLPKQPKATLVQHHPALPYRDVAALMKVLAQQPVVAARALEFTILTAARTSEVTAATWAEVDLESRLWIIPAIRIKAGREHRVPLSDAAVAILTQQKDTRRNEYVFPSTLDNQPLSNMAMAELLKRMREAGIGIAMKVVPSSGRSRHFTVHGFRSTFRDWAAEQTSHASEVAEMALAHIVSDKVEAAYRRGDLLAKRYSLMEEWATYCGRPTTQRRLRAVANA